ncbi:MAG: histidine kinase [Lachnospiraceae bacterium]|nr:histidine kinase [Lachnospiraceae bacterium]
MEQTRFFRASGAFLKKKWRYLTLRQKLTALFLVTAVVILAVNLYMFTLINKMTGRVEEVYVSNVNLNELSGALDRVQKSMEEYLNTKSSDAMEDYYRSEQAYRELMDGLNSRTTDNEMLLTEKNIRGLSESYLDLAAEAIQAKRGRNVEKYGQLYEDADLLYDEIHTFIYSLNNAQFKDNSRNYQALLDSLRYMELISIGVLLLVLLGNISLIVVSTRSVTRPLHQLAEAADEISGGNFEIDRLPVQSMDEVGIVTNTFNEMVENIRNYIEQLRATMERENQLKERELMMQSHLKDAQLKYLQAQINPHFLFNTLNAGAQLAMMEEADRTGRFLENVAEFFRYNVRKNDEDAALREEIHLVDNYVYILNVRFAGEILFSRDIDETLLDVRVPSMILQPLVENAFNYGIRNISWTGRIELSVYQRDEKICISIWDNGAGMEPERIEQVLSGRAQEAEAGAGGSGVGMKNVMERLRLYFRDQAGLQIFSEGKNTGTEVLITIPAGQEEQSCIE